MRADLFQLGSQRVPALMAFSALANQFAAAELCLFIFFFQPGYIFFRRRNALAQHAQISLDDLAGAGLIEDLPIQFGNVRLRIEDSLFFFPIICAQRFIVRFQGLYLLVQAFTLRLRLFQAVGEAVVVMSKGADFQPAQLIGQLHVLPGISGLIFQLRQSCADLV